jgi:exopolysaccharide biosynthesis protein
MCLVATALFLLYGPFEQFRLIWINTAMYSSRFKFLAAMLFSDAYIESVLEKSISGAVGSTQENTVGIIGGEGIICAPIKGNYFRGFIIKVDDPQRIALVSTENVKGEFLETIVRAKGALGGINASGYRDETNRGLPWGYTVIDGIEVSEPSPQDRHIVGGFTADGILLVGGFTNEELDALHFRWSFEFGPVYVINGERTAISEYAGGYAPRTAIGQTAEGAVLLVVVDGRQAASIGATFKDMQIILFSNGAVNAIGLDGGSSSTMVYDNKLLNHPSEGDAERKLPNAILIGRPGTYPRARPPVRGGE